MPPYAGRSAARTSVAMVAAVGLSASLAAAAPITFHTARSYGPAGQYQHMFTVAGDFDGDHDPDIAGARESGGTVEWWQNTGGVLSGPLGLRAGLYFVRAEQAGAVVTRKLVRA